MGRVCDHGKGAHTQLMCSDGEWTSGGEALRQSAAYPFTFCNELIETHIVHGDFYEQHPHRCMKKVIPFWQVTNANTLPTVSRLKSANHLGKVQLFLCVCLFFINIPIYLLFLLRFKRIKIAYSSCVSL